MVKRSSPGIGRQGDNLPEQSSVRAALSLEILDKEAIAQLNERRKRHRKAAEGNGVVLEDLDRLYKMRDNTPAEIETWFKRQWNAMGAIFGDLFQQFDLFRPKPGAPERRAAHRHMGLMAGLQGKSDKAPPTLSGDDLQQFLEGHQEGADARRLGEKSLADELAAALKTGAAGGVVDGTGKKGRGKRAEEVRDQADKDFRADNPDSDAADKAKGKVGHLRVVENEDVKSDEAPDSFEATQEELAAQTGRPQPEEPKRAADQEPGEDGCIELLNNIGQTVRVPPGDPRIFNDVVYPNKTRAAEARSLAAKKSKPLSQSEKAEAARKEAGLH